MALGFNPAQFQQATALDPAAAGLPAPQNLPVPVQQQAQPQPAPQAAAPVESMDNLPSPPQWGHRGWLGDMLDNLFLGGAIQHTRGEEYQRAVQDYNAQMSRQVLNNLPPAARMAAILNPGKTGESFAQNFAPQVLKEGETLQRGPGLGLPGGYGTKVAIDDKSGLPMALTPNGATQLGPSVGGDYSVKDGVILSGRTGPRGSYSQFQQVAPGSTPGQFQPTISAGGNGAPQLNLPTPRPGPVSLTPPQAAQGAPQAAPGGAPLPIRQNNFGALRALPNGQQWQGQVGVGPGGHVIFDTPQNGMRANLMNLRNKQAVHGLSTLGDIIAAPGVGWDPGNVGYAQTVSKLTGIPVNQPVDLSDPAMLGRVAEGIFSVENGPQAWQAYKAQARGPTDQATPGAPPQPPQRPDQTGGWQPSGAPKLVSPPEDVAGLPGKYQVHPDGSLTHIDGTGLTPKDAMEMGKSVREDKAYLAQQESGRAFQSMLQLASQKPGGMRAYALRDTFARTINPGAVARVGTIEAIKQSQGIPASVQAYFMNLKGDGDVPPQIVRQIIESAAPFAQTAWEQANALNERYGGVAKRNGLDPELATAPMDERPATPVQVRTPDEARKLPPGAAFWTPDGRLMFNHKGKAK